MNRSPSPAKLTTFLMVIGVVTAAAQGVPLPPRYYIRNRPGANASHDDLVRTIKAVAVPDPQNPEAQSGVLADINYPQFGFDAVAARLTSAQLASLDQARYIIRLDAALVPSSSPAGPAWALNQFSLPKPPDCPRSTPVVYLIDTGIVPVHPDFSYPPANPVLNFQPGLSYAYDLSVFPAVLRAPYTDTYDHGTRMAGCLGGITTGLLGALGGKADLKSVVIYDSPAVGPITTFVSQAISGILGAVADHQTRAGVPYLKNHASVLIFAHSTTLAAGRFGDLDRAIEVAFEAGLHVVISAGNEGVPAVKVSPAGAAWGYTNGGPPIRFSFGPPPATANFYRAADEFLVAGAYELNSLGLPQIWPLSNLSIPGADALDGFAPGAGIPCPGLGPPVGFLLGSGTSYSAAFTGALATWIAGARPWAAPVDLRRWLRNARLPMPGGLRFETPVLPNESLTYANWIHHYYPLPVSPPGADAPMADPDGDGVENFIEYYCGLVPRFDDAALRPVLSAVVSPSGTTLDILLPKACWLGDTPQVNWIVQRSTDLLTWTPVTLNSFAPTGQLPVADGEPWKATAAVTPLTVREFFRLRFAATGPL